MSVWLQSSEILPFWGTQQGFHLLLQITLLTFAQQFIWALRERCCVSTYLLSGGGEFRGYEQHDCCLLVQRPTSSFLCDPKLCYPAGSCYLDSQTYNLRLGNQPVVEEGGKPYFHNCYKNFPRTIPGARECGLLGCRRETGKDSNLETFYTACLTTCTRCKNKTGMEARTGWVNMGWLIAGHCWPIWLVSGKVRIWTPANWPPIKRWCGVLVAGIQILTLQLTSQTMEWIKLSAPHFLIYKMRVIVIPISWRHYDI